jgi:serine/threonine protein phosphatase PrpC
MILLLEDQGQRDYMEDRLAYEQNLIDGFDYLAVFDGHGGAEVASYLKTHMGPVLKDKLKETLQAHGNNVTVAHVQQVLYDTFKQIVHQIPTVISTQTGSTAIVVLKYGRHIWTANAGDSRAIMNKGTQGVVDLSTDHKPNRTDEYERIVRHGGTVAKAYPGDVYRVNGVLAVSRSIGDFILHPHVTWVPEIQYFQATEKNGYVFLGSDGIWDVLSSKEVVDIVNRCIVDQMLRYIGKEIVDVARTRGSEDNIAFLIAPI